MSNLALFWCWILGDQPPSQRVFAVELSHKAFVSHLKDAIKERRPKYFYQIDAPELELYKITVARDDLDSGLNNIDLNSLQKLQPTLKLSRVFPDPPPDGHLHFIVTHPPGGCK
jgi:hypothetical protein